MRIYIWSTNCFNKYRFKIWCKSMRYLVYSICSFHLKTRSIIPSGNIAKNKWLIFTWFWRKATVYNLQCPNNFFHNIRYINTGVQCLLSCAVADDDLRSLQSTDLWGRIWFILLFLRREVYLPNSSRCFFPFSWSVIADRPLDESSKVLWQTRQRAFVAI